MTYSLTRALAAGVSMSSGTIGISTCSFQGYLKIKVGYCCTDAEIQLVFFSGFCAKPILHVLNKKLSNQACLKHIVTRPTHLTVHGNSAKFSRKVRNAKGRKKEGERKRKKKKKKMEIAN